VYIETLKVHVQLMYMYSVGVELTTQDTNCYCVVITINPTLHNACNRGNCCVHV